MDGQKPKISIFDQEMSLFVMLSFFFTIPTWWIDQIEDDDLHFFIWDVCLLACKGLIPLMGYCFVENKILRTTFILYFGLTMWNLIDAVLMYFFVAQSWTMPIKITLAGLIVIYLMYQLWDKEGFFRNGD